MINRKPYLILALLSCFITSYVARSEDSIDNYIPPSSPDLFDKNEPLKQEKTKIKSQPFLSISPGFGLSSSPGGEKSATAWDVHVGLGYIKPVGSWNFFAGQFDLIAAQVGYDESTFSVNMGAVAKISYGMSLSGDLWGSGVFGAGLANASLNDKTESGEVFNSRNDSLGFLWLAGYELLAPMNDTFMFTGGLYFSQYHFRVEDVESDKSRAVVDVNQSFVINVPEFKFGLRVGF